MIKSVIVVPVYKSTPSPEEKISFFQLLKIFSKHTITIVTFSGLNIDFYIEKANIINVNIDVKCFECEYFESLMSYNTLCLNLSFYKTFSEYEYILIYQLDCYVFRDELEEWCKKGYDYVGAPWFTENSSHEEGGKLWKVGNGGFSLRKVDTFIKVLEYKKNIYSVKRAYKINKSNKGSLLDFLKIVFFGKNNRIKEILAQWNDAEDIFYCLVLENTKLRLRIPEVNEATKFAFEKSPRYLFDLNNEQLPFGCHAWKKYQYAEFWQEYIK